MRGVSNIGASLGPVIGLMQIEQDKIKLNRRLDFLLDGANNDQIKIYKEEYQRELTQLNHSAAKTQEVLKNFNKQKESLQTSSF